MTGQEASLVQRLCAAEDPCNLLDWQKRDGYYVATCRISADDVPGLIEIARRWNDPDWSDEESDPGDATSDDELLPVTAWRSLADLKAAAAVEPLVEMLRGQDDEFEDWVCEELPHVLGKIGEAAIEPLIRLSADADQPDFIRSAAVRGLRSVAEHHPSTRECVVACLTDLMANAVEGHFGFYANLLVELVELGAVEAAEPIERAFAANLIDIGMMGDWEEVRRELGVEGLGLEMPKNPYNSIDGLRKRIGIGIFSNNPLFLSGDTDQEAVEAYYERARRVFSQSREAQQSRERHGHVGWIRMLLEFGLDYHYEIVDVMTLETVQEFVDDFVPRKVSTEADSAAEIIDELALFWEYLDRVYQLPAAKSIVEWLRKGGRVARLKTALSDSSNFGMAKFLFMRGQNAGFDMTTNEGLAESMEAYNASLNVDAAEPISRGQRVGRNAPCPCGSGKKFKKCCGQPGQRG